MSELYHWGIKGQKWGVRRYAKGHGAFVGQIGLIMEYLAHHGIKGMKWGVRRYQNPDGSLTIEGERRYNINTKNRTVETVDPSDTYAKPRSKENPYSARRTVKIHKARERVGQAARAKVAADEGGNARTQRRMQRRLNTATEKYLKATKDPSRRTMNAYAYLGGTLGLVLTPGGRAAVKSYMNRKKEVQQRAVIEAKAERERGYEFTKQFINNYADGVISKRPDRY